MSEWSFYLPEEGETATDAETIAIAPMTHLTALGAVYAAAQRVWDTDGSEYMLHRPRTIAVLRDDKEAGRFRVETAVEPTFTPIAVEVTT